MIMQYNISLTDLVDKLDQSISSKYFGTFNGDLKEFMKSYYRRQRNRNHYKRVLWFPIRIPIEPVIQSLIKLYQADSE